MPTLGLKVNIEPLAAVVTKSLIRTPTHMLLICTTTPELTTLETVALPVMSLIAKLAMCQKPEMTLKTLLTRILVSIITCCQQSFNTAQAVTFQGTRICFCLFMNFEANTVLVKNYKLKHSYITCC